MRNIVLLTLIVAQLATGIHGVEVLVKIPEDLGETQLSKIVGAIANLTRKQEKHWVELEGRFKGLERKIDELESKASMPEPMPASTPEPEPSPMPTTHRGLVKLSYDGTAGSNSICSVERSLQASEFAFQNLPGRDWCSKGLPGIVWFKFSRSHRLAKISFSNSGGMWNQFAPKTFQVVGSKDCSEWVILLHVVNSGFTKSNSIQTLSWMIPEKNRKILPCIGLRVRSTVNANDVILKNIVMWEESL